MVQKRSFYDEEIYSISRKHPRQVVQCGNELVSFSEFVPTEVGSARFPAQGESGLTENAIEHHEKLASEIDGRFPISGRKDVEDNVPGRNLISSSNIGFKEDVSYPRLPNVSCRSEYFTPSPQHPCRAVTHHEDMYSLLLRYPPRKAVPIGSDHQADIPEWSPRDYKLKTKFSGIPGSVLDARLVSQNDDDDRLMGTCVIPNPDLGSVNELENVKIECCCLDDGSIRCVRQHVVKARDELEKTLGKERFEELGFGVMGEQVATKWSEKEEQLFYEVVFSNPLSLGRNFWNCLSAVFPSRTKEDIVSYYFNVFMLRRRAAQNRCKSKGIIYDSDDDEWQVIDDYDDDDELEITEDYEDSPVESPLHQDDHAHIQSKKDDRHACDRYDTDDTSDDTAGFGSDRGTSNFLASSPKISYDSCSFTPNYRRRIDGEVQDDSCTSSDTGVPLQGTHGREESNNHWSCGYNGLSYGSNQDDDLEDCNVKLWDVDYTKCPKIEVGLLSTCRMIEEVFGEGSLKYKARDERSLR